MTRLYTVYGRRPLPFATRHVSLFDAYIAELRRLGCVVTFSSPWEASWLLNPTSKG